MTRAEAIKALDEWCGRGDLDEGYCRVDFEANILAVEGALYMAIDALREQEQSQWIGVEERLPERDEQVLCRYVFGQHKGRPFYQVLDYYAYDPQPHFQHEGAMDMKVTHWMPLPEPPKED